MDDRAGDVSERKLWATTACGHRDARKLLSLDRGRHGRVTEQRRRDSEVPDNRAQAIAEQPATGRQHREAAEKAHERMTLLPLTTLAGEQPPARPGSADERDDEPDHEQRTLQTRQLPVQAKCQQGQACQRRPGGEWAR